MGISVNTFGQLVEFSSRFQTDAPCLMLGRQKFRTEGKSTRRRMTRALQKYRPDLELDDLIQEDGYAERMFDRLGFRNMETLDGSDYEFPDGGPIHVHDLNRPVPETLHDRFGFIYDGGTTEHVFNVPVALENIFRMLKPGGRLIGLNPLNGMPGHAMYQFSAELVFGFWARMAHCNVVNVRAYSQFSNFYRKEISDPQITGRRTKYRSRLLPMWAIPPGNILLQYEVEKLPDSKLADQAIQANYQVAWGAAGDPSIESPEA